MNITPAGAMADKNLLAPSFRGESWDLWRAVLKATFAERMTEAEKAAFRKVADRDPPKRRVRELWAVVGRRGGKDSVAAAIASTAAMGDYSAYLRPGERASIMSIASARTVAAVERLARYDRRHAATVEQWDVDPWLLNTPGGVVDLRTGKMRQHRPADHITKITSIAPGGECPKWLAFLQTITNKDEERQKFLQRVAGYNLTGSIREHALFFYYGTGGNGKGVFLNTLTGIMGDYAAVASMETFTSSGTDRHPTDLAMLRGARLVTAQETEEGRKWAESRIKAMTGGDPITARFMRQDFFTFQPSFKLNIAGNHKPGLRNVDEAIRRRFNLFPFDVKIPAAERNPELPEELKAEWPGILKWMIAGCLEWQSIGLAPPKAVTDATAEYFESEDAFGLWFKECCAESKNAVTASYILFKSWTTWADQAGEFVGSQKRFSQTLSSRGYEKTRIDGACSDRGKPAFKVITAAIPVRPSYHDDDPGPSL